MGFVNTDKSIYTNMGHRFENIPIYAEVDLLFCC